MPKLYSMTRVWHVHYLELQKQPNYLPPAKRKPIRELCDQRINKRSFQQNIPFDLYFWRDNTGNEMDIIIDKGTYLYPVEIKAGKTIQAIFQKSSFWSKITGTTEGTVIYAGDSAQKRSNGVSVIPWNNLKGL